MPCPDTTIGISRGAFLQSFHGCFQTLFLTCHPFHNAGWARWRCWVVGTRRRSTFWGHFSGNCGGIGLSEDEKTKWKLEGLTTAFCKEQTFSIRRQEAP